MSDHANFEAAFSKGHVFKGQDGDIPMRQCLAGNLVAPSGRIIACDPMFVGDSKPFRRKAPAGKHPVFVAVANLWGHDERVACARIRFGQTKPVKWQLALQSGQKLSDLGPNEFYGFGVDGGTGCYVDAEAIETLPSYYFTWDAHRKLDEVIERRSEKGGYSGVIPVGRWGGPTLVGFNTGLGDGSYPSYWGFDKRGRLVTLDTDFGLLCESIPATVTFDNPLAHLGKTLQDAQMKAARFSICPRRRRNAEKSFVVEVSGSASDLSVVLLAGDEEILAAQLSYGGDDATYSYQIDAAKLAKVTAIRVEFTKGVRAL